MVASTKQMFLDELKTLCQVEIFSSSDSIGHNTEAVWMVKRSQMSLNIWHSYATLKFVYDIGSWMLAKEWKFHLSKLI